MRKYIGTKVVNAKPMTRQEYNDLRDWTVPADENPSDEGYLVEYIDGGQANHPDYAGYISWSPKEVFERAYRPTTNMTFGDALVMLKEGKREIQRSWAAIAALRAENERLRTAADKTLDAIQDALQDAYSNAYLACCGRGGQECCGCPEPEWDAAEALELAERLQTNERTL